MQLFKGWCIVAICILVCHGAAGQQLSLGKTPYQLHKSAVLELNADNQGLLLSRITDTTLINVLNPPDGMLLYFTPGRQLLVRAGGYWQALSPAASLKNYWSLGGNASGGTGNLGTTDNYDLPFITANTERLRIKANGFVGIGTAAPAALLHLAGSNPLRLQGVQNGTATAADSLLTLTAGLVRKVPVSAFQAPLSGTGFVKLAGTTLSYDNTAYTAANTSITGATKTKITYDSKGLVTAGADATTSDIAEGSNLYYTDTRVRSAPLTGLLAATATPVVATDNLLTGLGKLQGQINTIKAAGYLTGNQTITLSGDITGSGSTSITTAYTNVVPAAKGGAGSINGLLKANGSGLVSAAIPGADYQLPLTLTTTGTDGAATLSGSTLNIPQYTGFANPMTTAGDLLYGGPGGAATRLAGNSGTERQFLVSAGTGTAATAPVWGSLQTSDIPNRAVTYSKIQNVKTATLLGRYAGTNGVAQEISIGTGLSLNSATGLLSATNNGTVTSFSAGPLLPLFTTSVDNADTAPELNFTLNNAPASAVFGNFGAAPNAPLYNAATADGQFLVRRGGVLTFGGLQASDLPALGNYWTLNGNANSSPASLGTKDNYSLPFITNNAERMRISNSGNVGIGITDPGNPLVVKDVLEVRRTANNVSALSFTNTSGTGDFRIGADGGDIFWQGGGGRNLQMGAYWSIVLAGDRQTTAFPAFSPGNTGVGVLVQAQRSTSVPLAVQGTGSQSANLTEWKDGSGALLNVVKNDGSVGLGTSNPNSNTRLDVSGKAKLGINGTVVNNVVAVESTISGTVPANGYYDFTVTLPAGSTLTGTKGTVAASPNQDLPATVWIAFARVVSANTVRVRMMNSSGSAATLPGSTKLYVTIIDF